MTERIACDNTWPSGSKTAPKQVPSGNHYGHGHAHVAGLDTSIWGAPGLTLYGTTEAPQLFAARPMAGTVSFHPDPAELVRFAREVLTFYGQDSSPQLPPWRPASNGAGARPWFVCRYSGHDDQRVPLADRYHFGAAGTLVRYPTQAGAQRAADKLNAAQS